MSSSRAGWRAVTRRRLALLAVLAMMLAAAGGLVSSPAEAQTGQCVTARNAEHLDAGRATRSILLYRAVGSNDSLGFFSFSTTSLRQEAPGYWARVTDCQGEPPPPTSTTSTSTPPGGERPPLEQRYQSMYETDFRLPDHTIYRPTNLDAVTDTMPVVVWGNGACSANGTWFQDFLLPLSAHGILVIANGSPNGSGQTDWQMLTESVDWAVAENSRAGSKYQGKLDTGAIIAMGQSCGGIEAVNASADDDRIQSTVLWNSGLFSGTNKAVLQDLPGPTAWFTGGSSDIAYSNAIDDYDRITRVPAVLGHYGNVGHTALFSDDSLVPHTVDVATDWMDAVLYDNAAKRAQFVGSNCGLCSGTPWRMQSKNW